MPDGTDGGGSRITALRDALAAGSDTSAPAASAIAEARSASVDPAMSASPLTPALTAVPGQTGQANIGSGAAASAWSDPAGIAAGDVTASAAGINSGTAASGAADPTSVENAAEAERPRQAIEPARAAEVPTAAGGRDTAPEAPGPAAKAPESTRPALTEAPIAGSVAPVVTPGAVVRTGGQDTRPDAPIRQPKSAQAKAALNRPAGTTAEAPGPTGTLDVSGNTTAGMRLDSSGTPSHATDLAADSPSAVASERFFAFDATDSPQRVRDLLLAAGNGSGDANRIAGAPLDPATGRTTATAPVPLQQLPLHIAVQAQAGNHRFDIRLNPAELGRVDIRLEIAADGSTLTHVAVEKPETLDLLQRDQRTLERALQNAGLDARDGSLSFSLRDDPRGRQWQQAYAAQPSTSGPDATDAVEVAGPAPLRRLGSIGTLDISI